MANNPLLNLKRWQKYLLSVLSFLVLGFFLFFVIDNYLMPFVIHYNQTLHVPKVTGLPREEAISSMERRGMIVQNIHEQYDEKTPSGRVINQLPYPGAEVKKGRRVYLTVSKGKETIKMPVLTGLTLRDARITLMQKGLQLGDISYENSADVPAGVITGQSILPNTAVPYGGTVQIAVSTGPAADIAVPDLTTGYTLDEARDLLNSYSLTLGQVLYEPSDLYSPGQVFRQDPKPGTLVTPFAQINIVIAQ